METMVKLDGRKRAAHNKNYMSIAVSVLTTSRVARNNGGAARRENRPQSAPACSFLRYAQVKRAMRNVIAIFFFTVIYNLTMAQEKISGNYQDYIGSNIELKFDSTFKFTWRFDLASSWSVGKWTLSNDTIHFQIEPVFDTLRYYNENLKTQIDTLVLSLDNKPEVITRTDYALTQITSGGQNTYEMPSKLYYRKDKLYYIDKNGKLILKKVKGFMTNKKHDPCYVRK